MTTTATYITAENIPQKERPADGHKGTFGHVLVIAGSNGMAGSSVLAARAALCSGCGLVTVHGPKCNRIIVQTAFPEAMFISDGGEDYITEIGDISKYTTLVIGPGIGTQPHTVQMLTKLLPQIQKPCILDADALNILGQNKNLLKQIYPQSILTPHPKEFERLFGTTANKEDRTKLLLQKAKEYNVIIILKGAGTLIATPDGKLYKNTTGNAGMATAGSGDVLAGMLGGILAQGYTPEQTAIRGVYMHGKAGDDLLQTKTQEQIIASDLILSVSKNTMQK